jgi:hypothetical protein
MISGIALLTATLLANASTPAPLPDVAALIARLARPAPADTAYAEVHFAQMLRKPLLLRGSVHYGGPGQLGKRVEQPYRETTAIVDGQVEVTREGRTPRYFSLDRAPELQALLASFSALLGGDAAMLEQFYTLVLVENASNWTLTLTPRAPDLAKHLREIVVDGAGNEPHCFSLHEADGDASVMLLGALAAAKLPDPPTANALAALCRAAP